VTRPPLFTIGHSTRSLEEFVALLQAHRIDRLADIRTVPRSRRHPHFSGEALAASLATEGIEYRHFPGLGGLRKPGRDSINTAWQNASFRGYADYMQTDAFARALDEVVAFAGVSPGKPGSAPARLAMMCAESVWWRCHRRLTADALVARGFDVFHIESSRSPAPHALTGFARVNGTRVTYPGLI
jgi:uncharacterized protein (DUF488 family)